LASLLLLLRSRFAVYSIIIAIIGLIGSNYFQATAESIPESLQSAVLPILIWSTTIFMLFYALRMKRKGVLK